jgi:hypothetical protein
MLDSGHSAIFIYFWHVFPRPFLLGVAVLLPASFIFWIVLLILICWFTTILYKKLLIQHCIRWLNF